MQVLLNTETNTLQIQQTTQYFNNSKDTLQSIFFHDWANAFSDKNSELGKRFVENYKKKFFFTKQKNRGYTDIYSVAVAGKRAVYIRKNKYDDFIEVPLKTPLFPGESKTVEINYIVKIPHAKFTDYGVKDEVYNLRFWHLVPVVYTDKWELMSHLDMDDLYQKRTDYKVSLSVPESYKVVSNLEVKKNDSNYLLTGENQQDFELHIAKNINFENFQTAQNTLVTDLNGIGIEKQLKTDLINRQLLFLKEKLGDFPQEKILINKIGYHKNPLYGFSQLPDFLRPFSDTFEWDLRMFKALSKNYIDNTLLGHTRENVWLQEALQAYMMMQYVALYYPEEKMIGRISNLWGVRSYHISKLPFNERYNTAYQYVARTNLDQALTMQTDSLTNFNRFVTNKYKGAIAIQYLDNYLGNEVVPNAIKHFFESKSKSDFTQNSFQKYIENTTDKDVSWFFNDFIQSDKKIDYKIKQIKEDDDSVLVLLKNKKSLKVPVQLYGLKNDSIISKKWISGFEGEKLIKLPNTGDKYVLNYKSDVPEVNFLNNTKKRNNSLFSKPLQIRWLGDVENPNASQLFFEPSFGYNYYNGFLLASTFSNKVLHKRNFKYEITPAYAIKSNSLTGLISLKYWKHLENKTFNSYKIGLSGAYFHYKPELAYKKIVPYAKLYFKRKNLRSVVSRSLGVNATIVNRDKDINATTERYDKYNLLNFSYGYSNPEIINSMSYYANIELGSGFSKFSTAFRYRKLTDSKRQFDIRVFAGAFMHNNTTSDFFSFGVNRPNDDGFRHSYYGRSEDSGFLSQQIIISDAGFKSKMPVSYANQWVTSVNTSVGVWRWVEIYNDVGFVKNRNTNTYFLHDHGVRLNLVNDILEVYFPIYSNNGWETNTPYYEDKIRFVFTANFSRIYNFMRRGFM